MKGLSRGNKIELDVKTHRERSNAKAGRDRFRGPKDIRMGLKKKPTTATGRGFFIHKKDWEKDHRRKISKNVKKRKKSANLIVITQHSRKGGQARLGVLSTSVGKDGARRRSAK